MTAFVVLFRGVGGATQLPAAPLRAALTGAGFDRVATYINSGNAVLASDLGPEDVRARIADVCVREFGFRKDIHVRTRAEWAGLVAGNPFPQAVAAPRTLHAAVLAQDPDRARLDALRGFATGGDDFAVVGRTAHLHTPGGFSASALGDRFDKGLGVPNTARNWNTVLRLRDLVAAADG